jgi:hypothetical protein
LCAQPEIDSLTDFLRSNDAPEVYRRGFPLEIHAGWLPRWLVKIIVTREMERLQVSCARAASRWLQGTYPTPVVRRHSE